MKILVLGSSGMLGSALIRILSEKQNWKVIGTIRSDDSRKFFDSRISKNLVKVNNIINYDNLAKVVEETKPEIVINCISLDKELLKKCDPLMMIPIYALLPHQLSRLCKKNGARLVQISTDGVFSGKKGNYKEDDARDSEDLYGTTKAMGELIEKHTITIRTSIIGHEISNKNGLVDWFLSQKQQCECFSNAIFSGFPTVILSEIIRDFIIPNSKLNGIYHIASKPISKCKLLTLINKEYGLNINLITNNKIKINRSLNADRFKAATGYVSPDWKDLIRSMHLYKKKFI